jgi:hypothetical protein
MKYNNRSLLALLAPAVLAQDVTRTSSASSTTSPAPSCTAELIAELCDYKSATRAVAADRQSCLSYCDSNPPCDFVIFAESGNPDPTFDLGTCWVYPGETYDASAGTADGCNNKWVNVYDKPVCEGSTPTEDESCAATASPSAVAEVCDYPTPPDNCFNTCAASEGASHCLSLCAEADDCNYVVFNPLNESNSPYLDGSCWMYSNGTYDADAASTCSGEAEQYVYTNPCPKPPKPSSSSAASPSSGTASATTSSAGAQRTGANGEALPAEETDGDEEGAASAARGSMTGLAVGFAALLVFGL